MKTISCPSCGIHVEVPQTGKDSSAISCPVCYSTIDCTSAS